MIGFLTGTIAGRTHEGCLIDVGGVGYRVACSTATLASLPPDGRDFRLWTYLHVREDVLALYGFATESEQRLFEALLAVAGVGPKVALAVCSSFSPDAFRRALVADDVAAVAAVPGIGKKTAQRLIFDLKEKLSLPELDLTAARPDALAQARSALENLGYSSIEVRAALSEVDVDENGSVEDMVRWALKVLA